MTTLIGKKVTVSIGGEPPKKNPDEIVGSETIVHVTEEEAKQYDRIVGEEVHLTIGGNIDELAQKIIDTMQQTKSDKKQTIIEYCTNIISEKNSSNKLSWARKVISFGSDIAQISSFIIQLNGLLPK